MALYKIEGISRETNQADVLFVRADTKGAASARAESVLHTLSLVQAIPLRELPEDAVVIGEPAPFRSRPAIRPHVPINMEHRPVLTIALGIFFGLLFFAVFVFVLQLLLLAIVAVFGLTLNWQMNAG